MSILNIQIGQTGLVGVIPRIVYISTNDTLATVTTAGYLNKAVQEGFSFSESDMALVSTKTTPSSTVTEVAWLEVSYTSPNWSLVPANSPGEVVLPTVANNIVHATNVTGTLSTDAANVINRGNIQAGQSGTAGYLATFPATAARGSLRLVGANSAGDTVTQITNASQAAARIYTIPDGGQAASSFLLTDSAGTQTIATGSLALTLGNITATAGNLVAGSSASAGSVTSFSGTGTTEFLRLAAIDNAGGNFSTTISNASSVGQSQVITIPNAGAATANFIISASGGTQNITSGSLQVNAGSISSGISTGGFVGLIKAFSTTATSGFIAIQGAINGSGDFGTTISNATTQAQAQVITVPNAGAATANFLLDTGAANILAMQQFVGLSSVLAYSAGTWTTTRIAQGNYVKRHTAADDTTIIGIDITPMIRIAASKGFRLDSFDVIYSIATLALDAHTLTMDRIAYANNVAVSVTSIALTGTLSVATQANPYVTNIAVTTPAFDITDDSKYVIELTVDAGATSSYDYYGIMLRFSQTIA